MSLEDLNKEIYNSNSSVINNRQKEADNYNPFDNSTDKSPFKDEKYWKTPDKGMSKKQKIVVFSVLGILLAVGLTILGVIYYKNYQKNAFHEDRVSVVFNGPKEADSTSAVKYTIHYKNNNKVTLKNAELLLTYSENFQPLDNVNLKYLNSTASKFFIGDIKPGKEGDLELNGVFFAPKDFPVYLRGVLSYIPSNSATGEKIELKNQLAVNISSSPVLLDLNGPQQVVDGDIVEYVIDYKNLDIRTMKDLQLKVSFPAGFEPKSFLPQPSERNNVWYVGLLEPNQTGKISIRGIMQGSSGEEKVIKVAIGRSAANNQFAIFNQREKSAKVVTPMLSIVQELEEPKTNFAKAGDLLKFVVKYKNNGNITLRDSVITAQINSKVLDYTKLKTEGGSFDSSNGIITWKASDIPKLASLEPQAGGEIRFSVPIKNIIPIENGESKNYVVTSQAKIDSPDIPTPVGENKVVGSNRLEIKVATKMLFDVKGFYNDSNIKNIGPMPMVVGKPTTYTLYWSIANISNDVTEAKIVSSLPSGVRWTGKIFPSDSKIEYNERTNSLIWDIGNISAGTGVLTPKKEVAFQILVTPQPNQAGSILNLLNKSTLTAKDSFTGEDISISVGIKDTQLKEDTSINSSAYMVSRQ